MEKTLRRYLRGHQPAAKLDLNWYGARIACFRTIDWMSSHRSEFVQTELEDSLANRLEAEITAASGILELEDDWDGQGSPAISRDTWNRAIAFLRRQYEAFGECEQEIDVPTIAPGPVGSIDLHWKAGHYELLVNIPADIREPASFYGDDYGKIRIKGSLDTESISSGLVDWLMPK